MRKGDLLEAGEGEGGRHGEVGVADAAGLVAPGGIDVIGDAVQLRQIHLSGMDDLYVVLNQLLAHPAPKEGLPIPECRARLGDTKEYPYLFYITPQRIEELVSGTVWEETL